MKDETIDFPTIDLIAIADSLGVDRDDPRKSKESISYLLRMLWLGRFDKMSLEKRESLTALSQHYSDVLPGYENPSRGIIIMQGQSHHDLAGEVVRKFMETLAISKKPKSKRKGFMKILDFSLR